MVTNVALTVMSWASSLRSSVAELVKKEAGQDLIEYAILVGAIGISAGAALFLLGPDQFTSFKDTIADCLKFNEGGLCE